MTSAASPVPGIVPPSNVSAKGEHMGHMEAPTEPTIDQLLEINARLRRYIHHIEARMTAIQARANVDDLDDLRDA